MRPAIGIAEPGIVDVALLAGRPSEAALARMWSGRLSADEHARWQRLRFEPDRAIYLATRALVRTLLSRYAPVAPAAWRFACNAHGKPRIAGPATAPPLHFNLSNTDGLVACAVSTAHAAIGIDVERVGRPTDHLGLAESCFAKSEVDSLRTSPVELWPQRFFTYWTLKESYVKACGTGLSMPLDSFAFAPPFDSPTDSIEFAAPTGERAADWRFASFQATPAHQLSVAVRTGGADIRLRRSDIALTDLVECG